MTGAVLLANSAMCAAGRGTEQVWASVRAGISRISSSNVLDRYLQSVQMGLVPEDALEPALPPEIDLLPWPQRARRMLRLAAPVLRTVIGAAGAPPVRLFLGLPQLPVSEAPWLRSFALYLGKLAGVPIDAPNSRVVPSGRAAALVALELALDALQRDRTARVIVGGVDTMFDLQLLASLGAEGRILGPRVAEGFVPAEGAAFMVLAHPDSCGDVPESERVLVQAAASAMDPAHRYSSEPARGEGLAEALETLQQRLPGAAPVATTFAGLNGESFDSKLWGVARIRHGQLISPEALIEHPADCFGDTGAAAGAILMCLAAQALQRRHRPGPVLVWAASDTEPRACAYLSG